MLSGPLKIAIDCNNNFFTYGLKQLLQAYASRLGREVLFTQLYPVVNADIFILSQTKTYAYRMCRLGSKPVKVIVVVENNNRQEKRRRICFSEIASVSLHDKPETFLNILELIIYQKNRKFRNCPSCKSLLNKLEADILSGISNGCSLKILAERFNVSTRSVSRYKRNAMKKLALKNNLELYRWLQIGGLENERSLWL